MQGGHLLRLTLEIRPRIPAVDLPLCPPRAMALLQTKDNGDCHKKVAIWNWIKMLTLAYRRCQGQLVQVREACAPPQIGCLIECLPAAYKQHVTRTQRGTYKRGATYARWKSDNNKTGTSLSGWGEETKRKCSTSLMSSAKCGPVTNREVSLRTSVNLLQ